MVVPPTDYAIRTKDELRSCLRKKRKVFAEECKSFVPPAHAYAAFLQAVASSDIVAGYAALTAEPDVFSILEDLRRHGKIVALPAMMEGSEAMVFREWRPDALLTSSAHGFRQPPDEAPSLAPDVVLVPLVGFDRHFNRLGHGKGHFDRALSRLPAAMKIGVAWSVQEVPDLPVDQWDVPLDAVLTEREWRVRRTGAG